MNSIYKTFESEHRVRPDDIDMYNHVHNSKYFDYVLAAPYDQMDINYGMSMDTFFARGYGWLVKAIHIEYKRALVMGDSFIVRTGIDSIATKNCRVNFTILIKASGKVSCDGWFDFVLIDMKSGKAIGIPNDVVEHFSQ